MEALSLLMPLMQMGMSGSQSMMNTGLGLIPTLMSLWERFQAQHDPLMRQVSRVIGNRYNQAVTKNPFGDAYGSWGGLFGTNDAGNSIGVGEAQARSINQMMQENPAASGIANYQQLAQAQRPDVVDTTSGLASLMGNPSQFSGYEQPNFTPQAPDMGAALNTDFSGSAAPRDTREYQYDPRLGMLGPVRRAAYNFRDFGQDLGNTLREGDVQVSIQGPLGRRHFLQPLHIPSGSGVKAEAPSYSTQPYWQHEAASLGPNPRFGRVLPNGASTGFGARPRQSGGLRALGQMFGVRGYN